MKRKSQQIATWVIVGLLGISLLGGGLYGGFLGLTSGGQANSAAPGYRTQIDALLQQLEAKPDDVTVQRTLANTYYDLGATLLDKEPEQAKTEFKNAIDFYQKFAGTVKEAGVYVDMATAAFYSGENEIADKAFQDALAIDSKFYNAHFNYGFFLAHAKQDLEGAIKEWQLAKEVAPTADDAATLQQWIDDTQKQLNQQILDKAVNEQQNSTSP